MKQSVGYDGAVHVCEIATDESCLLLQVNGKVVTYCSHEEVVRLIKGMFFRNICHFTSSHF